MIIDAFEFWKNLDNELVLQGKSLREMSEAIGLSYNTISTQRQRKTVPKVEVLADMARFVGVPIERLIGISEMTTPLLKRVDQIRRACMIATEEDLALVERILRIGKNARVPFDFSPNPFKLENR